MIISSVEIQKSFIRQRWNIGRFSAGIYAICSIRVQTVKGLSVKQVIRTGISTLHLIIYNTVIDQVVCFGLTFIMPSLLLKDLLFFINIRMEYRIQIDVTKIGKILVIAACYRINCLIRIGHGI